MVGEEVRPPKSSPAGKDGQEAEKKGRCRRCGRRLKNPKWQALGLGPICAAKVARESGHR